MPSFRLVPFSPGPLVGGLQLTGTVERDGPMLRASYVLSGALSALVIPERSAEPARREGLWRHTCVELFVAPRGQARYFEVNLSPGGDFDAYEFTGYREGMAPLGIARFHSHATARGPAELALGFELTLGPPPFDTPLCDIAATAVLEHRNGERSYWALSHCGERPDFHLRDSFLLQG